MSYLLIQRAFYSTALAVILFSASLPSLVAQPRISDEATIYTLTIIRTEQQPKATVKTVSHLKGSFKIPDLGKATGYDEGTLVVKVSDASGKEVYEAGFANPVDQYIEHVNEKGELDRRHVQTDADVLDVRIPFNTNGHTVSLYVAAPGSRLTLLSTF